MHKIEIFLGLDSDPHFLYAALYLSSHISQTVCKIENSTEYVKFTILLLIPSDF